MGFTEAESESKGNAVMSKHGVMMEQKILVAYASKYGATAEIANKIGDVLRDLDLNVDVLPVKQVQDVGVYTAVILGSAVYIGQWRREAVKFLKANEGVLGKRPFFIFSSGPTGEGDPVEMQNGWQMPGKLQPIIERIQPGDIAVFHGAVDTQKLNFIEKWMLNNVKAPAGDFRDWDAITAWATTIADDHSKIKMAINRSFESPK
ncbi:MAG: flavodoxin [Chloroflexi bacterium]|nr:MAG: flavodoxin [Chloroflexota bacterium]